MWPVLEALVAMQHNRQRVGHYMDRTMALVFKIRHINTEFRNYDVVTGMLL